MTSDVNYTDIFFSFLTGVIRNFSACQSKFSVFIRNWPACFEKASFLYAGFYCITGIGQAILELLSFKVESGNHQMGISLSQKFLEIFEIMRLISLKMT